MDRAQKAALASAAVGLLVLGLKLGAYWLTGSLALYSDALESIINVVAAVVALVALRVAAMPADDGHPYGHHKAEYFSAVLEGILIVGAALLILKEAYFGILSPKPIETPTIGIAVNILASAINGVWAWLLMRWGRRWQSPSLIASSRHVFSDVLTSGGVVIGVALVAITGWLILDPLLAGLVALNILWSGWVMVRDSMSGLLDAAAPPEMLTRIRRIISEHGQGADEAHDVRTRYVGRATFIEFHLVVSGAMTVAESHAICDRLEQAIKDDIEGARVTIHVEPQEKAKHSGIVVI